MKFAAITSALCVASMLAVAPAAPAVAQDTHQHTGTHRPLRRHRERFPR